MLSKIIKYFSKPLIVKEMVRGTVYYRFPLSGKHIKKEDYILGWGQDTTLINEIHRARIAHNEKNPDNKLVLRDELREQWDNREGYYITGKKIETKIHPFHSKMLLNIKTGTRRIIDTVTYEHWFGKFITFMVRDEGSKSHGEVMWENISCHDPDFSKKIKQNNKLYKLIDKE